MYFSLKKWNRTYRVSKPYNCRRQTLSNQLSVSKLSIRHYLGVMRFMLKNYFRLAWRHLLKNKGYTAINIAGLATGMAIAIVIGLWITDELTFDHYHRNHGRIAQGMITQFTPDGDYSGTTVSIPMGKAFRAQCGDLFSSIAQVYDGGDHLFAV